MQLQSHQCTKQPPSQRFSKLSVKLGPALSSTLLAEACAANARARTASRTALLADGCLCELPTTGVLKPSPALGEGCTEPARPATPAPVSTNWHELADQSLFGVKLARSLLRRLQEVAISAVQAAEMPMCLEMDAVWTI